MIADYAESRACRLPLREGLRVAVPLWVAVHRDLGPGQSRWRAEYCARFVSERGDQLLFRMKKLGRSQEVFNRLAEGLALMALQCGEAAAFGLEFTVVEGRCCVHDTEVDVIADDIGPGRTVDVDLQEAD